MVKPKLFHLEERKEIKSIIEETEKEDFDIKGYLFKNYHKIGLGGNI